MRGLVKGRPSSVHQQNFSGLIINYAIEEGVKGRNIPFTFSPENLSDTIQANFNQTQIPGASAPQITYTATGARTVNLALSIPFDYLPPNTSYSNFEDYLNSFRALTYPKYLPSGKVESPHCSLRTSNITVDGVCTNCSIEYITDRYAIDGSMSANISLSFLEVLDNVHEADAKWIANSKVNILNGTVSSIGSSSNTGSYSGGSSSDLNTPGRIALIGSANQNITYLGGLKSAIKAGVWTDPGSVVSGASQYTVKLLYGYAHSETASVTDIRVEKSGKHTCVCNGQKTELQAAPFDSNYLVVEGQTITYFIVYIPVSNGNNYDVDHSKIRYVHIKEMKR